MAKRSIYISTRWLATELYKCDNSKQTLWTESNYSHRSIPYVNQADSVYLLACCGHVWRAHGSYLNTIGGTGNTTLVLFQSTNSRFMALFMGSYYCISVFYINPNVNAAYSSVKLIGPNCLKIQQHSQSTGIHVQGYMSDNYTRFNLAFSLTATTIDEKYELYV